MDGKVLQHYRMFLYEETDLSEFLYHPFRIEGGFVLLCTQGKAVISSGIRQYNITKNTSMMFLSGMTFYLLSASEDFEVRMFTFSKKLYDEIVMELPSSFTQYMNETPVYEHPDGSFSMKCVYAYMDMAKILHEETIRQYETILQRNFLQNYMLCILGNVQPYLNTITSKYTKRQKLYLRFISLVHSYCAQHHDIIFYASQLCISPRYLYILTYECSPLLSPKQLIDKQLILEIKALLFSSDLTVTEIAQKLNFPDQSYLCRYFKRHTDVSPTEYRNQKKIVG